MYIAFFFFDCLSLFQLYSLNLMYILRQLIDLERKRYDAQSYSSVIDCIESYRWLSISCSCKL